MYKYEIHCHTKNTSRCGHLDGAEIVKLYKEAGYSGVVITDHYSPMTFSLSEHFNKKKAVEHYLEGYKRAKACETEDFKVFLGMELRFYATVNDYLVYGISENDLFELPFLLPVYLPRAYSLLHSRDCLLIQAHPFREFVTRANPKHLDGAEVFNGKTSEELNNKALLWAQSFPQNAIMTGGSDCHSKGQLATSGIITKEKLTTNTDLVRILKSGEFDIIKNKKKKP